jgi:hypothetical protein
MTIVNYLVSLMLLVVTAGLSMFYIGSIEEHMLLMKEHFWSTFALRFGVASILGLIGTSMWWGMNILLMKSGFLKRDIPNKTALILAASPICGALVGTLIFCSA